MTGVSFRDDVDGGELDRSVWVPHYMPEWSSRARTAATYAVRDGALHRSTYPMQTMVAVFDSPGKGDGFDDHLVPELVVDRIWGGERE